MNRPILRPLRRGHAQPPQSAADVPALSNHPTLTKPRRTKRIPMPTKIHTPSPVIHSSSDAVKRNSRESKCCCCTFNVLTLRVYRFPGEVFCRLKGAKASTYIWRVGALVGSDPKTATHWRCLIPDSNGLPCRKGPKFGLCKFSVGNISNLTNSHIKRYYSAHFDQFKSTSVKSLAAAEYGAEYCVLDAVILMLLHVSGCCSWCCYLCSQ